MLAAAEAACVARASLSAALVLAGDLIAAGREHEALDTTGSPLTGLGRGGAGCTPRETSSGKPYFRTMHRKSWQASGQPTCHIDSNEILTMGIREMFRAPGRFAREDIGYFSFGFSSSAVYEVSEYRGLWVPARLGRFVSCITSERIFGGGREPRGGKR